MAHWRGFGGAGQPAIVAFLLIGCGGSPPDGMDAPDAAAPVADMAASSTDLAVWEPPDLLWARTTHDAGPTSACAVPSQGVCNARGWCLENPFPSSLEAMAVHGTSPGDVWVATKGDTLLHFDGTAWSGRSGAVGGEIVQIFASAPGEVWVARNDGAILRGDGKSFTTMIAELGQGQTGVRALFTGGGRDDLWIWRSRALVHELFHWDGKQMQPVPAPSYPNAIFAAAGGPIRYIDSTTINRFDGKAWVVEQFFGGRIGGIWGRAADDIWAIGGKGNANTGVLLHYDGKSWSEAPNPPPFEQYNAFGGAGPSALFATFWNARGTGVGMMAFDGKSWTQVIDPSSHKWLGPIYVAGPGDVWLAPSQILHWDGQAEAKVGCATAIDPLQVAWGSGENDVWVAGRRPYSGETASSLYHYDGKTWSGGLTGGAIDAIAGTAPDDVWTVGEEIRHFDGKSWSVSLPGKPFRVPAIQVLSRTEAYAAADDGSVLRWDGGAWTKLAGAPEGRNTAAMGIAAGGPRDISVVTDGGGIFHWNGRAWAMVGEDDGWSRAMFAARAPNDLWVAGPGGGCDGSWSIWLRHWNGTAMEERGLGGGGLTPTAMWAAGDNDVWFAGQSGLYHFTGGEELVTYEDRSFENRPGYAAIGGRAPHDLWAAGQSGLLAHWDGMAWTEQPSGTEDWLVRFAVAGKDMLFFGEQGTILRRR